MATRLAVKPLEGACAALPALTISTLLILAAADVAAQTTVITPRFDTSLTWTDNAAESGVGGFGGIGGLGSGLGSGGEDWILEVSPGVSIARSSGRLTGNLQATVRNLTYANNTEYDTSYLALNGGGQFEAVEDMLFIDADASISRDNQSAFSTRGINDTLDVGKNNETRTFTLSPRFEFRIGNDTEGSLRYERRWSQSDRTQLSDQDKDQWAAKITNTRITGIFGLGLEYARDKGGYGGGSLGSTSARNSQEQEIARATLYAKVTPSFRLRGIVGREQNNYDSGADERQTITGGGFDWDPSERTSISGTVENRLFGNGYDFSLQHRFTRTTLFATFSRDIQSSLDLVAGGGLGDPLYLSLYDAILRGNPGISPTLASDAALLLLRQLRGDVLTNAYFVSRSARAGVSHVLRRGVVSLSFSRADRSRLGSADGLAPEDDFSNFEDISTDSLTLTYSHRLTPQTSLNTSFSRSTSTGRGGESADTDRTQFQIGLSSTLGPNTTGALTYRHQRSVGDNAALGDSNRKENAVTATLGMSF